MVVAPDRRGDVDALVGRVGPAPLERAGVGIETGNLTVSKDDDLWPAVEVDQDGRRVAVVEVLRLPNGLAGRNIERDHTAALAAGRRDHHVLVGNRARRVTARADHARVSSEQVDRPLRRAVTSIEALDLTAGRDRD